MIMAEALTDLQRRGVSRMNITEIELGMRTLRKLRNLGVACGILAALASPGVLAQQKVDTVVTNGKILTVDAEFRVVEAIAINEGRIVSRGTSAEVARYAGPNTKVIDVKGATVIPGLIDNHFHFTRAVERWHQQARFEGVDSRREALRILAAKAASLKPGEWIMVQGGWTPRQFADAPGGFTLEELDGVAPKNPLFVQEGYSLVYANSLALKAVGLNPADGARRSATGLVSFQPPYALYDAMPTASPAQLDQNLTDYMHELNATGLTGVYSLGQSKYAPPKGRCRFDSGRPCRSSPAIPHQRPVPPHLLNAAARTSSTASTAFLVWPKLCTGRSSIWRPARSPGPPRS